MMDEQAGHAYGLCLKLQAELPWVSVQPTENLNFVFCPPDAFTPSTLWNGLAVKPFDHYNVIHRSLLVGGGHGSPTDGLIGHLKQLSVEVLTHSAAERLKVETLRTQELNKLCLTFRAEHLGPTGALLVHPDRLNALERIPTVKRHYRIFPMETVDPTTAILTYRGQVDHDASLYLAPSIDWVRNQLICRWVLRPKLTYLLEITK